MEIKRNRYLQQLISYMWDGQVKVITGIRRCGKSYLLRTLFKNHLLASGVSADHILSYELDLAKDIRYRNPLELSGAVRATVENSMGQYYLFIDEIQMSDEVPNPYNPGGKCITFYDALNDLNSLSNLDIYVTGSNSKMLSSDILSEFRGRSDEIHLHPLCFAEYYSAVGGDRQEAFENYAFFGGLPLVLSRPDDTAKMNY
ncbi:MAG: AAA family ATPase, partial [Oscillospiraceae bacterium]|nr:AAA family ATPase [Oscillospiraceae bacterium]